MTTEQRHRLKAHEARGLGEEPCTAGVFLSSCVVRVGRRVLVSWLWAQEGEAPVRRGARALGTAG